MRRGIISILSILGIFMVFFACASTQEHPSGKKVAFEIGAIAPNFTARDLDGNQWELWNLAGKKVILSFWATYDVRSRMQLEDLQDFYNTMDRDSAVLLGLTYKEDEGDLIPFLQRRRVTYPNIIDKHGSIGRLYGITVIENIDRFGRQIIDPDSARAFPVTVLINEDSTIDRIISVQININLLDDFVKQPAS